MSSIFTRDELIEAAPSVRALDDSSPSSPRLWEAAVALFVLASIFWWTYETDIYDLIKAWETQADYSHGYLVPPLAMLFLYARRATFPGLRGPAVGGFVLLALALAVRLAGQWLFLSPLQGWSMILWIGGACWVVAGGRCFRWLLPSITFLFFMVPLPYRIEGSLSYPLQRVSTKASTWIFQLAGLPAVARGNTILIDSQRFEVEEACSGLRMLIGVGALAFAYAILSRSSWVEKVLLLLCVVPVAVAANCLRIVGTGFACRSLPGAEAQHWAHDIAGWTVIPIAAAMLFLVMAFWRRVFVPVEDVTQADLLRESELLREPTDAF